MLLAISWTLVLDPALVMAIRPFPFVGMSGRMCHRQAGRYAGSETRPGCGRRAIRLGLFLAGIAELFGVRLRVASCGIPTAPSRAFRSSSDDWRRDGPSQVAPLTPVLDRPQMSD